MAKKQSPPPPNPHSPHILSQNPNPNLMAKKQASPLPNPNIMAKKQPSPPPNPTLMAKKQAPPPPNPNLMAKKQPSPPPNPSLMAKKQAPPPNPNLMAKKQPSPPPNPNLMAKKQTPPPPNNPNLMAKKQLPPPSAPPSSSSEDEESSSASNDEEAIIKKPNTQTPTNNQEKQEEETGYETDSESSDDEEGEEVNQPETKRPQPISTTAAIPALNKPCDHASKKPNGGKDSSNNEDDEGESDSSSGADEERRSNTKKPQAAISMTAATPALKPRDGGEKPNGKVNASGKFQRIWSLDDEIGILKAITEFEVKHGPVKISLTGIWSFHDFVKDSLSLEVSDSQLYEKVRRLRRKYKHRANRGNTIKFGSAHDEKVYHLSKKIWGAGSSGNIEVKKVAKSKRAATALGNDGAGSGSLKSKYPFLRDAMARTVSAELLEAVVDPENARLLEVTFKKQKVAEINYKKCEMKLMIEAFDKVLEDIEKE